MKQIPLDPRGVHDQLKALLEAGGRECPVESCGFCAGIDTEELPVAPEAKTYTEDELTARVTAAVATAVAEARSEGAAAISELEKAQRQSAVDAAVATALEAQAAEVARLQNELDAATLLATAEKTRADAAEALEADRATALEEATALAATKDARIAEVRTVVPGDLADELIAKSADRWASMTDEDFETVKDSLKEVAAKVPATSRPIPRAASRMTASEEPAGDKPAGGSALRALRDRRYAGQTA